MRVIRYILHIDYIRVGRTLITPAGHRTVRYLALDVPTVIHDLFIICQDLIGRTTVSILIQYIRYIGTDILLHGLALLIVFIEHYLMIDQFIWLKPQINVFCICLFTCITPDLRLIRPALGMEPIAVHDVLNINYLPVLILIVDPLLLYIAPAVITYITYFFCPRYHVL